MTTYRRAKLKSSGKIYLVCDPEECGTKEVNEARRDAGKCFWLPEAYGKIAYNAWLEKDGKRFGRIRTLFSDQLEFID